MRVSECEDEAKRALEKDDLVSLLEAINGARESDEDDNGAPIGISCQRCTVNARAYFSAPSRSAVRSGKVNSDADANPYIVLCANHLQSEQVYPILRHELVHAYDHYVGKMDLTKGCDLACSEIRAAKASECSSTYASGIGALCAMGGYGDAVSTTGIAGFCRRLKENCVRSFASISTKKVFPKEGDCLVRHVFEKCYASELLSPPEVDM